ncbi:hypothetical protein B0J17DRAFT_645829 [Rhizoctonia solani]|nr:hypothetical protein B0J17DRAFT_645829 [Rhizoctonia solani]
MHREVDIIAWSRPFTMFTASKTADHIRLLILNATTVESLGFYSCMREGQDKL